MADSEKTLPSISPLKTPVQPSSLLMMILSCFFLLMIPSATALNFDIPNIGPQNQNKDIVTQGNGSYISDEGIQVTPDGIGSDRSQRAGRATYIHPLHLWDNASGQLADFSTNFSFVIDSNGAIDYADGITFFLAQNGSTITSGGAMGLPTNASTSVPIDQFVAVEFDTYWNPGIDPVDSANASIGDHVGIDVNSLKSVVSEKWWTNITSGKLNEVWIKYDSVSKNLSVSFTGYQNNILVNQADLEWTVDLRKELPEWVIFGFSAATGARFQKNNIKSWSFQSTDLQVDESNGPTEPGKGKGMAGEVGGIIFGLFAFFAVSGFILFLWLKKRRAGKEEEYPLDMEMDYEFEMGSGPKRFSYSELSRATKDFAEEEKLGEGGFGGVYRGCLREMNSYIAVKRVSKSSKQGIKEYASEVRIISRLRHRNLVQLLGWCHEKKELLLVYEFMENGSLDSHLFKEKRELNWEVSYKIARGLASALLYLHEEWEQCVLHRDIKSSNVMLDSNFNAKLGDFGLAKLVDHEKGSQTTVLAGTMGYMAPESCVTGKVSKESDVYSFGVVALEIACGRKPIEPRAKAGQMRLVEWVWELYGLGKLLEAVDPRLGGDFDEHRIQYLMIVGLWCAHPDHNLRPSMKQVIQVLNNEAPLPILPSKMPVATYLAPPAVSSLSALYGIAFSQTNQTETSNISYNTNSSKLTTSSSASSTSSLLRIK